MHSVRQPLRNFCSTYTRLTGTGSTAHSLRPALSALYARICRNPPQPASWTDLVLSFGITVTYLGRGSEPFVFNFRQKGRQIFASEGPLKGRSSFLVPPLKG